MAQPVFLRRRHFSDGQRALGQLEYRVVAEAAAAARHLADASFPARLADQRKGIVTPSQVDERTAVAGGAFRRLAPVQRCEKLAQIVLVARVLAGVARGVDAGRT